ncbi:TRM11 family SAM-dependent methyltransferase [Helicovermis profundi]|uniref:Ribosomal RNA large subunit methyltransferase K/L-like methyltransferase domain-containing protein n=1 Tax=Helicovermis profundi TaxID=3065157 RepID=A0AAU9E0V2_9FIRM|nr:hypothetical protein HLPR_01940 [Clostridia bacterium S502]
MYNVNYSEYEEDLCNIEVRSLFNMELKDKIFYSKVKIDPSISPFIKNRFKIIYKTLNFEDLLIFVENDKTLKEDFIVKYLKLLSGDPYAANRNSFCKKVASKFRMDPNYRSPKIMYAITFYKGFWYFGELTKNNYKWRNHNNRPYTYSNSLKINMAKVLINIAGKGDLSKTIVDPLCGAGTVLLEGCFAGYDISGYDIGEKISNSAKENVKFFSYKAKVTNKAIQDVNAHYDVSIVDLPYGLRSQITPEGQRVIIENAKRISDRIIVVSSKDISLMIENENLKIVDKCKFIKSVKRDFARYVWVCEHDA